MEDTFSEFLAGALREIASKNLLRRLRSIDSPPAATVSMGGRSLHNFSSNDYLGLAGHPELARAAAEEVGRSGFGAGASRLVCGTLEAHERLETTLATFKGTEAALSFSSGYAAAMGVIPALAGKDDVLILDKLCHACLVDAARLSGAVLRVFPHNDLDKLESHLAWSASAHPKARVLVLAESVYSMDGDLAPLKEMVKLKERFGAWLFLDEAHGVGVLGRGGRGLAEREGVSGRIEIQMGTLGKALGAHGAYVAGSRLLRDYLINRARSFIYSTAPPPSVAAAAARAVEIASGEEGDVLRSKLHGLCRLLGERLEIPKVESAIIPIIIGEEQSAVNASAALLEAGFLVPAIRYPTVAKGTARLRVTLTAAHTPEEVEELSRTLRIAEVS